MTVTAGGLFIGFIFVELFRRNLNRLALLVNSKHIIELGIFLFAGIHNAAVQTKTRTLRLTTKPLWVGHNLFEGDIVIYLRCLWSLGFNYPGKLANIGGGFCRNGFRRGTVAGCNYNTQAK